jgi:CheY-like chemotaxis protein
MPNEMKILVIDDDPSMTDLLGLILRSTYATVIAANSGAEGVRLIQEQLPDAGVRESAKIQFGSNLNPFSIG